eukprot:m51a1_g2229 hypothetical protein (250) ;mRNA; r:243080-244066
MADELSALMDDWLDSKPKNSKGPAAQRPSQTSQARLATPRQQQQPQPQQPSAEEPLLNTAPGTPPKTAEGRNHKQQPSSSKPALSDQLDHLLSICGDVDASPTRPPAKGSGAPSSTQRCAGATGTTTREFAVSSGQGPSTRGARAKCKPLCAGGTQDPAGLSAGKDLKSCDNMRCTKCDMNVLTFSDCQWKPVVNYLFFRISFPDTAKLQVNLEKKPGSCARACQCSWLSSDELQPLDEHSRWVCAGHN